MLNVFDSDAGPARIRTGAAGGDARSAGGLALSRHVLERDRWLWYNSARPLPGGIAAPIGRLIERMQSAEPDGSDRQTHSAAGDAAAGPAASMDHVKEANV